MTGTFPLLCLTLLLAYAGVRDLLTMRISNLLVGVVCAAYVLFAVLEGAGPTELGHAVLRSAIVLGIGFVLFLTGGFGAGDAKLASAVALWFPFPDIVIYFLLVSFIGGVLATAQLVFIRIPAFNSSVPSVLAHLMQRDARSPYGVAFALAAILMLLRVV